jgi:hypothetical protein
MKKIIFCTLFFITSLSLFAEEKYDWLINHNWWLESEYDLSKPPRVIFRKLEITSGSIMYQKRLRRERFTLEYQTEKIDNLFILEETFYKGVWDVKFGENYTSLTLVKGISHGQQDRVGQQTNRNYPLVGVWGSLPYLTEYRIIDPKECLIYMEIVEQMPNWAVREGTYLLKQIDENTFETVSSFPDGRLRLEVINERRITLLSLFTLPDDERGRISPLVIYRWP